jgi:CYTH domain-containing protein
MPKPFGPWQHGHPEGTVTMALEIERRFLVAGALWKPLVVWSQALDQGYLVASSDGPTLRVRSARTPSLEGPAGPGDGAQAWLTLKLPASGIARHEYEYPIPPSDGLALLDHCGSKLVKQRYGLNLPGGDWVLDVFAAENAPLVIAEVELERHDQAVAIPSWCVREITGEGAFSNAALAKRPFSQWPLEDQEAVLQSLAAVP